MQTYRYRAMTQTGELVNGSISAPSASEVAHRIEYLGLVPRKAPPRSRAPRSRSSTGRVPRT